MARKNQLEMELAERRKAYLVKRDFIRRNIGYVVGMVDEEQWNAAALQLEEFMTTCRDLHTLQINMRQLNFDLEGERIEQRKLNLAGGAA